MSTEKFKRVFIANRGEIALRIVRSLREMGLESVGIYSDADERSLHRRECDFAIRLSGNTASETYLNIPKLMKAIEASGAQAVHPGYGFLSESPEFARACEDAGLVFIGPSSAAMRMMGDKIKAKNFMREHSLPIVPGTSRPLTSVEDLRVAVREIGFPVILKAAAGGGGRGMRIVRSDSDLAQAFEACQREALAYFGNPDVFCERYIDNPRHIEFQVMLDSQGSGVHLFERDCSIQRRHQKLFEEAPSQYLSPEQRQYLGELAVRAAEAAGYAGAGTVEFICESPERAYFMEMNTRIQVEHPVTEMITGIDLIKEQIRIALGHPLSFSQSDLHIRGWAVEARINAEDPTKDFLPGPGLVSRIRFPQGPFVRVDSHLYSGYEIPAHYDSMVAKVIAWGRDRTEALDRLSRSLCELEVEGVPTTTPFHEALMQHPDFLAGDFTTKFIEKNQEYFKAAMNRTIESTLPFFELTAAVTSSSLRTSRPRATVFDRENWRRLGRSESVNKKH